MEEKVIYDGFFFDHESIEKLREILYIVNENCFHRFYPLNIYYPGPHITSHFWKAPDRMDLSDYFQKKQIGFSRTFTLLEFGTYKNEYGYVENVAFKTPEASHITVYVAPGGKAVNSAKCDFERLPSFVLTDPYYTLTAKFGIFTTGSNLYFKNERRIK